jgi:hypothetical protein
MTSMIPLKQRIIDDLIAQGCGPELAHPNASFYWTGTRNDICYVCQHCANTYTTAAEVEEHLRSIHPTR